MVGSLKARVGQLEAENEGLRTEVAEKRREARVAQDRLIQAESDNGELMARLDDARNLIRDQGGDLSALTRPDPPRRARTAPAGRDGSKSRKSPLTQIPGSIEVPHSTEDDDDLPAPIRPRSGIDPDDQSRLDGDSPWRPMVRDGRSARR